MRKIIFIGAVIFVCCLNACHEKTVGYLISENASYEPDTLVVPRELGPVKDAIRIKKPVPVGVIRHARIIKVQSKSCLAWNP